MSSFCNLDAQGADVAIYLQDDEIIKVYDLGPGSGSDEGIDIKVCLPGNTNWAIQDVGSLADPTAITTTIAAPTFPRQRSWLVGNWGASVNPTLPASGVGPGGIQEWWLATTSDTDYVSLETVSGLLLSGPWVGGAGSILYLQADGAGGWIEGGRNEI